MIDIQKQVVSGAMPDPPFWSDARLQDSTSLCLCFTQHLA